LPEKSTNPDNDFGAWVDSDDVLMRDENGDCHVGYLRRWDDPDDGWNGWYIKGRDSYRFEPIEWMSLPA
jgi:hypothetical protein